MMWIVLFIIRRNNMIETRGFEVVDEQHRQHPVYQIELPIRADRRSAGYDYFLPIDLELLPAQKIIVWTNIKAFMEEDEFLAMHIRSSLGIKQGIILSNITGIIDSSYYNNESNEGNIGLALLNTSGKTVKLSAGDRVAQGIFMKYLVASDDNVLHDKRTGGSGSSDR
jgi:dUTP pyrophosphatase